MENKSVNIYLEADHERLLFGDFLHAVITERITAFESVNRWQLDGYYKIADDLQAVYLHGDLLIGIIDGNTVVYTNAILDLNTESSYYRYYGYIWNHHVDSNNNIFEMK